MKRIVKSTIQSLIQPNLEDSIRRSKKIPCNLDELNKVTWCYMAIIMGDSILSKNTTAIETTIFKEFIQKAEHFIKSELEILSSKPNNIETSEDLLPQLLLLNPVICPTNISNEIPKIIEHLLTQCQSTHLYHSSQNGKGISSSQNMHLLSCLTLSTTPIGQHYSVRSTTIKTEVTLGQNL